MDPKCTCENCELRELFMKNLDGPQVEIMCSGKVEKEFKQGEIIIKQGVPIQDFTYLKSGLVKLFRKDSDNREQIITIAKPMDYVSLLSVFSNDTYNYSVSALEASVTCNLRMDDLLPLIERNGSMALGLLAEMSRVADTIILDSLDIRKKQLRGRVATVLLYFSREVYFSEEFDLPLSRKELAEYVGMTTENVIRSLSEFRKDGILRIYGKTIRIEQMDILQSIADFG